MQPTITVLDLDPGMKFGDVFIPRDRRPRNKRGNCVWCGTETIFWGGANLPEFEGIVERAYKAGWNGAYVGNIESYCRTVGVEFETGGFDVLQRSIEDGTGAVIFIPGHALACVGFDSESARVIDNNGSEMVRVWPRHQFDRQFQKCVRPLIKPRPHRPKPNPNHPPVNPNPRPCPQPETPVSPNQPAPIPVKPCPCPPEDAVKVVELEKKLKELEEKLKIATPGPQGPPGKDGKDGRDGKDGLTSKEVSVLVEKIEKLETRLQNEGVSGKQTLKITVRREPVQE